MAALVPRNFQDGKAGRTRGCRGWPLVPGCRESLPPWKLGGALPARDRGASPARQISYWLWLTPIRSPRQDTVAPVHLAAQTIAALPAARRRRAGFRTLAPSAPHRQNRRSQLLGLAPIARSNRLVVQSRHFRARLPQ